MPTAEIDAIVNLLRAGRIVGLNSREMMLNALEQLEHDYTPSGPAPNAPKPINPPPGAEGDLWPKDLNFEEMQKRPRCCSEDLGGSHYHCANCGKVSSMMGHYVGPLDKKFAKIYGKPEGFQGFTCDKVSES